MKKLNIGQFVIIITGPSGAGKTSLIDLLIELYPELKKVISITTRPIRVGEIPGENRIFVTETVFEEMMRNGELACLKKDRQGNFYAIPKILNGNIIDLDLEGIKEFRSEFPNVRILAIGLEQPGWKCAFRMMRRGDKMTNIYSRILNDKESFKNMDNVVDFVLHPRNQTVKETADAVWSIIMNNN